MPWIYQKAEKQEGIHKLQKYDFLDSTRSLQFNHNGTEGCHY